MAQEVEAVMPAAVVRGSDGYLLVDYDRLGLRMQTWQEWWPPAKKFRRSPRSSRETESEAAPSRNAKARARGPGLEWVAAAPIAGRLAEIAAQAG